MSSSPFRLPLLAGFALAALVAAPASHADVIHMKSGQKIQGKIVQDDGSTLIVDTKFGRMTFERAKVERIELQRLPREEVTARMKAAADDAAAMFEVAKYAKEKRLEKEYREVLQAVVAIDPNHTEANEALGRVPYDGKWFTPEELEAYKADLADQMKARGRVLYKGKWIKEETAKRLQGYELYKGNWLKWPEIYTLQAEENMGPMLGVELEIRTSEHFALRSQLDEESQREILDVLEAGFAHFSEIFEPDEIEANIMDFYPIAVYVFPDPNYITTFVQPDGYMETLYNPPRGVNERYVDAHSFPIFFPRPLIVASEGRHLKSGGSRMVSLLGFLSHYAGNMYVRRFKRGGKIPGWVESGLSHYYEGLLNGYRTLSVTEYVGYEHVDKWGDKLGNFKQWYERMADAQFRSTLPRWSTFQDKIVEEIDAYEQVKSYFLVAFMLEKYPQEFVDYVRDAYREYGRPRRQIKEEEAFQSAFNGRTTAELEQEFEAWVATLGDHPPVDG
ncbi:MAG: hypothetical protein ACF8XB_22890 [Planctomycetota bacterium JB042]